MKRRSFSLTNRLIKSTAAPAPGHTKYLWDNKVTGLGLRIYSNGKKSYVFRYLNSRNKQKIMVLFAYHEFAKNDEVIEHVVHTIDQDTATETVRVFHKYISTIDINYARDLVMTLKVHMETNPDFDPKQDRELQREQSETVADLCDRYMKEYATPNKKTANQDQRHINNHIMPAGFNPNSW